MNNINFSIVIVARNEAKTLPRLFASFGDFIKNGGEVIVLDTGSTDDTIKITTEEGCVVKTVGEKYLSKLEKKEANYLNSHFLLEEDKNEPMFMEGERIFNFGAAREEAHTYASNDMILAVDAADGLLHFDYKLYAKKLTKDSMCFCINYIMEKI